MHCNSVCHNYCREAIVDMLSVCRSKYKIYWQRKNRTCKACHWRASRLRWLTLCKKSQSWGWMPQHYVPPAWCPSFNRPRDWAAMH